MELVLRDSSLEQVANVATLPHIVGKSLAMPDIHYGYGFPIGGVAAMDVEQGIISPGGVGYDINCGVRLLRTNLHRKDITDNILEKLVRSLFHNIPSGVGSTGKIRISEQEVKTVLIKGARWAYEKGYGIKDDLEHTEEHGQMDGADPSKITRRALERGAPQLGTLGAGNHFLEIQEVEEIYDQNAAKIFNMTVGQITVMIHTGSRGLGYQVCDDNVKDLGRAVQKYNISKLRTRLGTSPWSVGHLYWRQRCRLQRVP
jgi:tRNA-splicing ligase RtcB